jgi:outer membrane murein-binding lipoprotein Lpp
MKKTVFATVLGTALLLASCVMEDSGAKFDPLPSGVYVAGVTGKSGTWDVCYWNGDSRIGLEGKIESIDSPYFRGTSAMAISTWGNDVLVTSNECYWRVTPEQQERYDYSERTGHSVINGGHVYWQDISASPRVLRRDKDRRGECPIWISAMAVYQDTIYTAGVFRYAGYEYDAFWNERYDGYGSYGRTFTDDFSFHPRAMTVGEGNTVYIAGDNNENSQNDRKGDVLKITESNRTFIELEGFADFTEYAAKIKRIMVSDGDVYVFTETKYNYGETYCYWINGKQRTINLQKYDEVADAVVSSGVIYMAGSFWNGKKDQACYWIDGQRHDLDGAVATAIYVEE